MSVAFLQIEPTTRCNYTCGFCCGRHMLQQDMAFETFETALTTLPDLRHVEIQGEGEPLLHPQLLRMIELARQRAVKVSFITNGSLLVPDVVAALLDLDLNKISVSIESADPATFRSVRGGKLDKVVANLEQLMAERQRRGLTRPTVGFSITVLRSTRTHLDSILALYRRLGLDGGITLNPLQAMRAYTQHYDRSMQDEMLTPVEAQHLRSRFLTDARVRAIQRSRGAARGFYEELLAGWRPARRTCPWLEQGLYVNREGHATPCCMVKDTARHSLGRIGEDDPRQILAGRERMRAQFARGQTPDACVDCELAHLALMPKSRLARLGIKLAWDRWFRRRGPSIAGASALEP